MKLREIRYAGQHGGGGWQTHRQEENFISIPCFFLRRKID